MENKTNSYKRTLAGSIGAGVGAVFNGEGRTYYILEHKTATAYHKAGESQKIIIDQIELGRSSSCQVRFDESCETVSRRHAAIVKEGDKCKLIPLSQTNGTYVNGNLVKSEYYLSSGDEIRLSSNGPVLGFIQPQGAQSLVKSIGLTERMSLFRKQALRPYKQALWAMGIAFVVAVGGLIAYNVYQDKVHAEQIAGMQIKVEEAKKDAIIAQQDLAQANADLNRQQEDLRRLKADQNATASELNEANRKYEAALSAANAARSAANSANERLKATEYQLDQIKNHTETPAPAVETPNVTAVPNVASVDTKTESSSKQFAEISQCANNVYFIRMDNIVVYDRNNNIMVQFPCENVVFGTGFLLEDGRFVTARRIARPWEYYINSDESLRRILGRDDKKEQWWFEDVQVAANNGLKVVANYTAFSAVNNFKFSSTDMSVDGSSTRDVLTFSYKLAVKYLKKEVGKRSEFNLYWYNSKPSLDWAVMSKRDQLTNDATGLKANREFSVSPVGNTELQMLGFPNKRGFESSLSVNPVKATNNINATGLNNGIIELASYRYEPGFDGAPVFAKFDGEWCVVGILGHTDGASRDNVTPIANVR